MFNYQDSSPLLDAVKFEPQEGWLGFMATNSESYLLFTKLGQDFIWILAFLMNDFFCN